MAITSKMNAQLVSIFNYARTVSWAPKLPYCPQSGAYEIHNSHIEQVTMYIQTKVIPIAYYDTEFTVARAKHLLI